jgi:hypothetical protein
VYAYQQAVWDKPGRLWGEVRKPGAQSFARRGLRLQGFEASVDDGPDVELADYFARREDCWRSPRRVILKKKKAVTTTAHQVSKGYQMGVRNCPESF